MCRKLIRSGLSLMLCIAMVFSALPAAWAAEESEETGTYTAPVVAEDTTIYYDNSASGWPQVYVNWANPQTNANEVKEIFDADGDGLYEATVYGQSPSVSFGPSDDLTQHLLWLDAVTAGETYSYVPDDAEEEDPTTPSGPVVAEDTTIYYDNSASGWTQVYVNWANPQTNANEVKEIFDADGDGLYEALIYGQTPSASFGPSADLLEHPLWLGMGGEAIVAGEVYRYVPETSGEEDPTTPSGPAVAEDTTIYYDNSASLWAEVYVNWANPQTNANEVKQIFDTDGDGLFEALIYGQTPSASFGPSADLLEHPLWLGMGGEAIVAGEVYRYVPETSSEDVTIVIPEDFPDQEAAQELAENTAVADFTVEVPQGVTLVIEIQEIASGDETMTLTFDVTPEDADGNQVTLDAPITFRLPLPASVTESYAKIYHEGEYLETVPVNEESGAKYVEITAQDFSPYSVEPTDHAYSAVVTPPTCEDQGYTTYTCDECGDSFVDNYVSHLGHDMGEWIVDEQPTCTERGTHHKECSRCDDIVSAWIPALGHSDEVIYKNITETTHDEYYACCDALKYASQDHGYDSAAHTCPCGAVETFTITWMVKGKEHAITQQEYGKTLVLPTKPTLNLVGETFFGWHTAAEGGDQVTEETVFYGTDNNTVYYGHVKYQMRMYGNGGIMPGVAGVSNTSYYIYLEKGYELSKLENEYFVNEGYVFDGWKFYDVEWEEYTGTIVEGGNPYYGLAQWKCGHTTTEAVDNGNGTHKIVCTSFCGETLSKSEVHDFTDVSYKCACGKVCHHTGNTRVDSGLCTSSFTCSVCKGILRAAGDHTPGEPVLEKAVAATCQEAGSFEEVVYCSVETCGYEISRTPGTVDALGHEAKTVEGSEATCTAPGFTDGTECTRCGETLTGREEIPALGHAMGDWVIDQAAACTVDGSKHKDCSRCDYSETETIPATGHSYSEVVTEPACEEEGYTTHTCSVCGDSYADSYVEALGHAMGDWVTDKEAACTVDGSKHKDCSRCDYAETETIPALGHETKTVEGSEATCTAPGLTDGAECTRCGETLTAQEEIPALGHETKTVEGSEATCTAPGFTDGAECTRCGEILTVQEEIPALGHDMGGWTAVDEETERRECSRCDFFETRTPGKAEFVLTLTDEELLNQTTVWIDGQPCPVQGDGDNRYVELSTGEETMLVTYTWQIGDETDVHTQYPTGMKVYRIVSDETGYTAEHIPELDNLLQYSGSSIRITGNKGIRMITSLTKGNKSALTGEGLAGFTLEEYGTALCWATDLAEGEDLVLGKEYTRSNYAYKKGVADPIFAQTAELIQYTNVLVGFTDDQCVPDIAMRPYIILSDAEGNQVTLYGGTVYRSIGYIAYQNRTVFTPGSASYDYVWGIIHYVYGDIYDADYQG